CTVAARQVSFNLVTSLQDAGITWDYNSLDAKVDYTRQNRDVVLNFLKAFIEGNGYIRKNKEESLAVLTHCMHLNDREALDETYDYLLEILPKKPYASDKGLQAELDAIAPRNPRAK